VAIAIPAECHCGLARGQGRVTAMPEKRRSQVHEVGLVRARISGVASRSGESLVARTAMTIASGDAQCHVPVPPSCRCPSRPP